MSHISCCYQVWDLANCNVLCTRRLLCCVGGTTNGVGRALRPTVESQDFGASGLWQTLSSSASYRATPRYAPSLMSVGDFTGFINHAPTDHGLQDLDVRDLLGGDIEEIAVEHDEIGELTRFE